MTTTNAADSMPVRYGGVLFLSRLEARWAAFFDLAGWEWKHHPEPVKDWQPTFHVRFPCGHSECDGGHELLCEVQPFHSLAQFEGHPGTQYPYGVRYGGSERYDQSDRIAASASAVLGLTPNVSEWEMAHGAGGGEERIADWVHGDVNYLWVVAGQFVAQLPRARA